jgi:hypothetical protein
MAYKLRKEYANASVDSIYKPLTALTQGEIKNLNEGLRDLLFIEEKPKKKNVSSEK